MANYIVTDTELTSIADAIIAKAGLSGQLEFPIDFVNGIDGIRTGGGADEFIENYGTMTEYTGNASTIGQYAFAYCARLTTVSFPNCTSIGANAFAHCSRLTTVSFPSCTTIGSFAFDRCFSLTTVNFPSCISIEYNVFYSCSSLTTVSFPSCTTIGSCAFERCFSLTTVSFPMCTTISNNAFVSCFSLTTVSFPSCTTIGSFAFQKCYKLLSLYLLGSSLANLENVNAFSSTPISNYTTSTGGVYGSIYVPASLYATYIASTNWVTYSSRFVSV